MARLPAAPVDADDDEPILRFPGLGCVLTIVVILLLGAGVVVSALVLTDGRPQTLLLLLTPFASESAGARATSTLPPTITPTVDGATPAAPGSSGEALPPPSGGDRLAFASNRDGDYEIFLMDVDGSNLLQLTANGVEDFDPAWSPGGDQIAYVSRATPNDLSQIMVMNADGSGQQAVTPADTVYFDPDWSPDGNWLAFSSNRAGSYDLYIMRPDGSDLCQLTASDRNELTPRWSPNGTMLGYHTRIGQDRATSELFMVEVNPDAACPDVVRGVPQQITDNTVLDQWLDWSPDGLRLAYTSQGEDEDNRHDLYMLDLAYNLATVLTSGAGDDDDPVWSSDGTRIAFDSNRAGGSNFLLYVLDVNTGQVSQITSGAQDDVAPAWQPR
ncbi:MAG: PD40 domain-containing protein [Anaerolineae bacterium]|nr:PD40 domain-containing protein [Anaerolineae bacterium]